MPIVMVAKSLRDSHRHAASVKGVESTLLIVVIGGNKPFLSNFTSGLSWPPDRGMATSQKLQARTPKRTLNEIVVRNASNGTPHALTLDRILFREMLW